MSAPTALIVVDVQKGFITDCSIHVLAPLSKVQHEYAHVVFTKFNNPEHSPFREILDYQKLAPGSAETELALTPRDDAFILDRPHYTCVTPALRDHLNKLGVREVAVCGIATEACVLKTVLDLFEHGIRTHVLADLCASDQDMRYHDMAIELLAKLVGKQHIVTSR